jgi:hypothetical protein
VGGRAEEELPALGQDDDWGEELPDALARLVAGAGMITSMGKQTRWSVESSSVHLVSYANIYKCIHMHLYTCTYIHSPFHISRLERAQLTTSPLSLHGADDGHASGCGEAMENLGDLERRQAVQACVFGFGGKDEKSQFTLTEVQA